MPTLSLARVSSNSFNATVGSTSGAEVSLYYQMHNGPNMGLLQGPLTRTGDGVISVDFLQHGGHYLVYAVTGVGTYSLPAIDFISLSQADSTLAAIRRRWNSFPQLLAVAGPLYANEIPERNPSGGPIDLPYTAASLGRSNFDWTFEREYVEVNTLDFHIFTKGAQAAEEAQEEIRSIFDFQALPFLGIDATQTVSIIPTDSQLLSENLRNKDGHMVWRAEICYRVAIRRRLAEAPLISNPTV